jgi:hypothetical protein
LNTSLQAVRSCPLVTGSWHRTGVVGWSRVESAGRLSHLWERGHETLEMPYGARPARA